MTGGEEDTSVGFVLSDDVGCGRCGQDSVLSDDKFRDTVCSTYLQDDLYGFGVEVPPIATDDDGCAFRVDGIEDGLYKVFGIMLMALSTM